MADRMDAIGGVAAGTFGWFIGMGILETVAVVLLANALHAFVMAYMDWDKA